MASLSPIGFIVAPQSRLWNARLLPSWFFCLYLLAGVAAAELALGASALLRGIEAPSLGEVVDADSDHIEWMPRLLAPIVAATFVFTTVGMSLSAMPSWSPWKTTDRNFVMDWGAWNYSGIRTQGQLSRVPRRRHDDAPHGQATRLRTRHVGVRA